jgi:uncharacterized protein (TIGR03435 family)
MRGGIFEHIRAVNLTGQGSLKASRGLPVHSAPARRARPNLHPPSDTCPTSLPSPTSPHSQAPPRPGGDLPPLCGIIADGLSPTTRTAASAVAAFPQPARHLAPHHDRQATIPRPAVDQTGLVGLYDFTLHWNGSPDPDIGDTTA